MGTWNMNRGGDATIGDWIPGLTILGVGIWCLQETQFVSDFDVKGWRWFGCHGEQACHYCARGRCTSCEMVFMF